MLISQRCDESFVPGTMTSQSHSLLSFSNTKIIHNASMLGVSMGSSYMDRVRSTRLIKDNELQRTLSILKNNDCVSDKGGDNVPCLIVTRASDLLEDLEDDENIMEDNFVHLSPIVNKIKRNKKEKVL
jgi:hypothetical protein